MAVTTGPRTGVTLWSSEDDPVDRTQFEATHTSIEALMGVDVQQTLPLPAPGIRGRYVWATDDRGGRLYRDSGAALFDLGPKPIDGPGTGYTARISAHASALAADDVLQLRGKTGQTGDLFRATDPTGATSLVRVDSAGGLYANAFAQISPATLAGVGLIVNGLTGQTGDLQRWSVAGATNATVNSAGSIQSTSDLYAQLGSGNQVRVGIVGGGAAAGVEFGSASNYIGTTAANVVGIIAGGATVARAWSNGELSIGAGQAGGTYRLNVLAPAGSNPPVYLRSTAGSTGDGNYQINLSHTGDAIGAWLVGHEGASNGLLKFAWETGGGPGDRMTLDTTGKLAAVGADHLFGPNALGGSGSRVRLHGDSGSYVGLYAEGSASSVDWYAAAKGAAGNLFLQTNGISRLIMWNDGTIFVGPGAGGTGTRTRLAWDATFSYIDGDDQSGTAANGNLYLRSGSIYNRLMNGAGEWRIYRDSDGKWLGGWQQDVFLASTTTAYFGPAANGGSGARLRIEQQNATQMNITSENAAGVWQTLDLRGNSSIVMRTGTGDPILSIGTKPASGTTTGVQLFSWASGSWGSTAIQYGPAGSGPGGTGRALWIS